MSTTNYILKKQLCCWRRTPVIKEKMLTRVKKNARCEQAKNKVVRE